MLSSCSHGWQKTILANLKLGFKSAKRGVMAPKNRLNAGLDPELYFFRDSGGTEVDLLFRKSHEKLVLVEIKGGMTWNNVKEITSPITACYNFDKIFSFFKKA